MKKNAVIFDTNILMDYAAGVPQARDIVRKYPTRIISVLTYAEILTLLPQERVKKMKSFLCDNFTIEPVDAATIEFAIYYKNHYRLSMPDAILYGYAMSHDLNLVTRNTKDFNPHWHNITVPYVLV